MFASLQWKKWLLLVFVAKFVHMPGRSVGYTEVVLNPPELEIVARVRQHIQHLAADIGERNANTPQSLDLAAKYIEQCFRESDYTVHREPLPDANRGSNVIAELPGKSKQIFVIGAHYDTVPGSPGANDNGSGIAALLEIARLLRSLNPQLTLRFVAFANEEHVDEPAEAMGSFIYARQCKERGENIVGMWSLETLGYYSNEPGSQKYPAPFDLFYPTRGYFVAFVGDEHSRNLVHQSVRIFRSFCSFPCEGIATPDKFRDTQRSDNWGFRQAGYPALMVTDTANYRYPHYHKTTDTPSQVCYTSLARVIKLLADTARCIALENF